jgi:hypothetical protein
MLCETWYNTTTNQFRFATQMKCIDDDFYQKKLWIKYFTDDLCVKEDFSQPGGTHVVPYVENDGHFTDTLIRCVENTDLVEFETFSGNTSWHGGCGYLNPLGNLYEPCDPIIIDPVPPSDGELICEVWFDSFTGNFVFATEIYCDRGDMLHITFYTDMKCAFQDSDKPNTGPMPHSSPFQEYQGPFTGAIFQCNNVLAWSCENEYRVSYQPLGWTTTSCHGGCGALDSNLVYYEEPCSFIGVDPTESPTKSPTESPTESPTKSPTESPSKSPTESPTKSPTESPTEIPTKSPTMSPTKSPTESPSKSPTESPTKSPIVIDPVPPSDGELICEAWFDSFTGNFVFATEIYCDRGDMLHITFYTDVKCAFQDSDKPNTGPMPHSSPFQEYQGPFTGAIFQCNNVLAWSCENEYRVSYQPLGWTTTSCHGGCGALDSNLVYYEEPCSFIGVDPTESPTKSPTESPTESPTKSPPSGGQLICERWHDTLTGDFVCATEMGCFQDQVSINYYTDPDCNIKDDAQSNGIYPSQHTETEGHFTGITMECPNIATWNCDNQYRVNFRGLVGGDNCHGGCGALDSAGVYYEEECNIFVVDPITDDDVPSLPPGSGGSSENGAYVGGIVVGGMFACGAAACLALGAAKYLDSKKSNQNRRKSSLLSPRGQDDNPSNAEASFGPGVELGETKRLRV